MRREQFTLLSYDNALACRQKITKMIPQEDGSLIPVYEAGKCPQRNDIGGCPLWMEATLQNHTNGETKIIGGCAPYILEMKQEHIWENTESAAKTIQAARNELNERLLKARVLTENDLAELGERVTGLLPPADPKVLEHDANATA